MPRSFLGNKFSFKLINVYYILYYYFCETNKENKLLNIYYLKYLLINYKIVF